MEAFPDPLNFTGTLFLVQAHWIWMLVALGLGCWAGWRLADEPADIAPPAEQEGGGT
jgi:hypothetical protein